MPFNTKLSRELAIFPLTVNVLPGGYLPLQIFEPRYLDMVKKCMTRETGFCVVLLRGSMNQISSSKLPDHSPIGTYVEIVDFNQLENGLLGITVQGQCRIQILDRRKQEDGLIIADIIEQTEVEESISLEPQYENIWRILKDISKHPEIKKLELEIDFDNSSSVAYNLASLLPLTPLDRQNILEFRSNVDRFDHLNKIVKQLGG
ncbi:MAG: LON peptidase substrate-binding domain-containing protein [SAR86 cluster bacterium]|jgi:Lon protease-like protein|nr:LON peptidase substrate-binding domain-containing protein [SAR86 cluster bacterium]HIC26913.1 ATP-dependent protease La (LON) domain protein [Gammaproteobacteria bacterium]